MPIICDTKSAHLYSRTNTLGRDHKAKMVNGDGRGRPRASGGGMASEPGLAGRQARMGTGERKARMGTGERKGRRKA